MWASGGGHPANGASPARGRRTHPRDRRMGRGGTGDIRCECRGNLPCNPSSRACLVEGAEDSPGPQPHDQSLAAFEMFGFLIAVLIKCVEAKVDWAALGRMGALVSDPEWAPVCLDVIEEACDCPLGREIGLCGETAGVGVPAAGEELDDPVWSGVRALGVDGGCGFAHDGDEGVGGSEGLGVHPGMIRCRGGFPCNPSWDGGGWTLASFARWVEGGHSTVPSDSDGGHLATPLGDGGGWTLDIFVGIRWRASGTLQVLFLLLRCPARSVSGPQRCLAISIRFFCRLLFVRQCPY